MLHGAADLHRDSPATTQSSRIGSGLVVGEAGLWAACGTIPYTLCQRVAAWWNKRAHVDHYW